MASQSPGGGTHRITASCGIVIQQIHRQIPLSTCISPCEFLAQGHEIHERKSFHSCMHSIEKAVHLSTPFFVHSRSYDLSRR